MPKPTLQKRLIDALIATGRGTLVDSRSRKYVTLKRADGAFFYVGRNGALRYGRTVSASVAATDAFTHMSQMKRASRLAPTMIASLRQQLNGGGAAWWRRTRRVKPKPARCGFSSTAPSSSHSRARRSARTAASCCIASSTTPSA